MDRQIYLKSGIHHREVDGTHLFLDVLRDRYFTLSDRQSRWFSELLSIDVDASLSPEAQQFAAKLIAGGILETDPRKGGPIEELDIKLPTDSIYDHWPNMPARRSPQQFFKFVAALSSASLLWRRNRANFSEVVRMAKTWKSDLRREVGVPKSRTIELVRTFHSLSPYFFSSHDQCLFRSLAMVRYLSMFGIASDWVFAVRLSPFVAHCWVEFEHTVLNEHYDRTFDYKPIMLI